MEITKTTDGNAAMLSLSGRADVPSAERLAEELRSLEGTVTDLVLDLDGLDCMPTCLLAQLVYANELMSARGTLTVIRAPFDIVGTLKAVGLYERLNILS